MTTVRSVLFNEDEDRHQCCCEWLLSIADTISKSGVEESLSLPITLLDNNENLSQYQSIDAYSSMQSLQSLHSFSSLSHLKSKSLNPKSSPFSSPAHHAKLTYLDVQSFGPPCNPLKFTPPKVYRGKKLNLRYKDPQSPNGFSCARESIIRIYISKDPNSDEQYVSKKAYCRIPERKTIETGMGYIEIRKVLTLCDDREQKDRNIQHEISMNGETSSAPFGTIYEREFSFSSPWKFAVREKTRE